LEKQFMPQKKISSTARTKSTTTITNKPAVVRRKRRSSEEVMERLIAAAREEFKRCGYVGATTAAIARNAEVTEAQLFRYFDSKADLFREAVFEPLNKHFSDFYLRNPTIGKGVGSSREHQRLYLSELQQFLGEHSKLLLALVLAQLFTSGSLQGVTQIESLQHYFELGADAMTKRAGKKAKIKPKLLVRTAFAALLGTVLFKDWIFPEGMASDEEINDVIIDFMFDGIGVYSEPASEEPAISRKGKKTS
jgi:AcrR family transcriptional regulator